jgi:hypothetical protein
MIRMTADQARHPHNQFKEVFVSECPRLDSSVQYLNEELWRTNQNIVISKKILGSSPGLPTAGLQ